MNITKDEVKHVAQLARLQLSEDEAERLTTDMDHVLRMAKGLSNLDTGVLEAMTHAVYVTNVFREDEVKPSYSREDILENSAGRDETSFTVPQVVE